MKGIGELLFFFALVFTASATVFLYARVDNYIFLLPAIATAAVFIAYVKYVIWVDRDDPNSPLFRE